MTHGSLFSGIGGFDLAAQWMGWQNLFHCEWNPFGQKVLKHYWPDAELFTDITKSDFTKYHGTIDLISGGFPCQPYSHAGKRLGKEDERHLWPEMLRAIREISPRWVVGENVSGLISWNGGMVFHEVQADLEAEGYEVQPFVLPAAGVGNCPHRRDRVWFVAYNNRFIRGTRWSAESGKQSRYGKSILSVTTERVTTNPNGNGHQSGGFGEDRPTQGTGEGNQQERERFWSDYRGTGEQGNATNACHQGLQGREINAGIREQKEQGQFYRNTAGQICAGWENFPTQPSVCSRNDGFSNRLHGITFSKWRNESIKAYGNAIVPQVALQIFKAIQQMEKFYNL